MSDSSPNERDRLEKFRKAALEAELETGEREPTVEKARAHIIVRLGRISLGFVLLVLGVLMLVLPGPGWLFIAAGLAIWALDFEWAERLLVNVRRRVPGNKDGELPLRVLGAYILIGLSATAVITWWTFR